MARHEQHVGEGDFEEDATSNRGGTVSLTEALNGPRIMGVY